MPKAPDSLPAVAPLPSADPSERSPSKVRIRFRKDGPLRFLSHHDLMRTFERMLRRADLPFRRSQGFHPKPRLVFALSLPLGVIGCAEVVELELDRPLSPEEVRQRLVAQTPPGLGIRGVRRIDPRAGAQVSSLRYGLPVPAERVEDLRRRIDEVLAAPECLVERTRPTKRRVDVRPFLRDLRLAEGQDQPPAPGGERPVTATQGESDDRAARLPFLEMDLWLLPAGTARPDELLTLLGLQDLLEAGAVLERTRLDLIDEVPAPNAEGQA